MILDTKISILLPTFNSVHFLSEAIDSILNQTYADYEFLIIDDGSTDGTSEILSTYIDPRLHIIRNEYNLGLATSLNRGLSLAKGKYIARMDADDVSLPDRFSKQVAFLDQHPNIGVVGAWYQWMNEDGSLGKVVRFPERNGLIQWQLIVDRQPLAHPLVMMRADAVKAINGYVDMRYSQDYDLFCRLARNCELANIPEVLLLRREHKERIGLSHTDEQMANTARTRQEMIQNLLGQDIPLEVVVKSFPPRSNGVDDLSLLKLLDLIYMKFVPRFPLTSLDKKEIHHEVGLLFVRSIIKHPIKRIKYVMKAIIMSPVLIGDIVKNKSSRKKVPRWLYCFLQNTWRLAIRQLCPQKKNDNKPVSDSELIK